MDFVVINLIGHIGIVINAIIKEFVVNVKIVINVDPSFYLGMCVYDEKLCYSNDGKEEGESCTKNNDCKFKSCKKIDGSYICCSKSRKNSRRFLC